MKKRYTFEEMRDWTVRTRFEDYDQKAVFHGVLWDGEFFDITFIQKKADCTICEEARPSYAVVATQCVYHMPEHYLRFEGGYGADVKALRVITKEEGNELYTEIKATRQKTKKGNLIYRMSERMGTWKN